MDVFLLPSSFIFQFSSKSFAVCMLSLSNLSAKIREICKQIHVENLIHRVNMFYLFFVLLHEFSQIYVMNWIFWQENKETR